MNQRLEGKKIVVTGGFGALGRAVGNALTQAGAQVALVDKAPTPFDLRADSFAWGEVDLNNGEAARNCLREAAEALGGLDGLVNVAGGFVWEVVENGNVKTWDLMYEMNVRTALLATQAALPYLLHSGAGSIVTVGALAAAQAKAGMGAYAASKAAVARLTEALAEELKDRGITVNAVLPSIIDTPANRAAIPGEDVSRWVDPVALAGVIAFLLSDAALPITGALIPVKGRV
ncbi:TPA: SDR family NAD(P)-dependent oxidoreductase [Burkholderia lata]|uniref:Short chain dehydrogenase n=1 Tax=Burkholderia aenigmatica TaxID=2015348 RepID=A0ABY6Y196_9BURK|nr:MULTISPECIES: SDR family NAD(P)-dependent oxidoreductase [Burkholderia]MCA8297133.1 SDR family NAD(P)-dependent oxidoreductase [Burkholderia sp. AU30198]VWD19024.1 short chain dehydrogenase [Burkholderia aenigmatica]VWD46625.1 short chain dehydrogenase [Burkholderia aenigmatica]